MFRRWAVCAPMITNPPHPVWEGTNATHPNGIQNVTYNQDPFSTGYVMSFSRTNFLASTSMFGIQLVAIFG